MAADVGPMQDVNRVEDWCAGVLGGAGEAQQLTRWGRKVGYDERML